jgi:anti-sigma B factor antagonist
MAITAETKNGLTRLRIAGEMTIYTAADLKQELMKQLAQPGELEIDLTEVSELDSAGLQLLILAKREAQHEGRTMRLTGHSPAVLDVLDICNLAPYFGDPVLISHGVDA